MVQHFSIFQYSHSSTVTKWSLCLLFKINESCGSFINSQKLIALQCLSLQSRSFLATSWTVAVTNHSPQQWGIIQNCSAALEKVFLQQSLSCGFCYCVCFYLTAPLCMRKTEVNQYFPWFGSLNLTTAWPFLSLSNPFCAVRKEFT